MTSTCVSKSKGLRSLSIRFSFKNFSKKKGTNINFKAKQRFINSMNK